MEVGLAGVVFPGDPARLAVEPVKIGAEEPRAETFARREAQTIYYSLAAGPAQQVIATLHDLYCGTGQRLCE